MWPDSKETNLDLHFIMVNHYRPNYDEAESPAPFLHYAGILLGLDKFFIGHLPPSPLFSAVI
jgi:hypothetical protein